MNIKGHIKAFVKDADGKERLHYEGDNTIHAAFLANIVADMHTEKSFELNDLFTVAALVTSSNNKDGIKLQNTSTGLWYYMDCTTVSPTAGVLTTTITGIFSGFDMVINSADAVVIGHDDNGTYYYQVAYANATSWTNLTLLPSQQLKLEWTFTLA